MNEPVINRVAKQIKAGNILDNIVTLFYYEKRRKTKPNKN